MLLNHTKKTRLIKFYVNLFTEIYKNKQEQSQMPNTNCLFCQIAEKKIPAKIAYEDEQVIAFHDIAPQAPIHILIIPKQHIATVNDFNEQEIGLLGHMILTAKNLANELKIAEDGYRLNINCNQLGGQTVFHTHLHLLAGRQFHWPPG